MIIGVTEQFHDYDIRQYFLDTDRLDPNDGTAATILEAMSSGGKIFRANYDARSNDDEDAGVPEGAKVQDPSNIEGILYLHIYFE
jgi:hypothetical protein